MSFDELVELALDISAVSDSMRALSRNYLKVLKMDGSSSQESFFRADSYPYKFLFQMIKLWGLFFFTCDQFKSELSLRALFTAKESQDFKIHS